MKNLNYYAMKNIKFLFAFSLFYCVHCFPQNIEILSPDKNINVIIANAENLGYAVKFKGRSIINDSPLGFEFKNEPLMDKNFKIISQELKSIKETWIPVVKSKHAEVLDYYNELHLKLKEKAGLKRQMDLIVRAYNDGIAFQFKLYRGEHIGNREIIKELTYFNIPGDPKAWIAEYGGYATAHENVFSERNLSYLNDTSIAGIPLLMDYGDNCFLAITEAKINNYSAFYLGTNGTKNQLVTKLAPLPGQAEDGTKVRFNDDLFTPWRVIMIGDSPGVLIESEIIQNLNDPCAIEDPSWIKPGISAWDHWWSGEVKMEMPVIKEYIDFASVMGWEYMLVDWQWYGKYNSPEADICKWAPQLDMPEIIDYARSKNVRIILWLYSKDVNRNSAYKKAFPLYKEWGIAGIKIDFMDRDDQEMVNWYREIIQTAAENELLVDFHGAYKPDGIIRTYPNMITREGVMGNEYYKFSEMMSPEHNVTLAFTRILAGQMDYTPGGFLNVTKEQFKKQSPTLVWNTRAAELAKFVIYESPLTVVCDHPDHILNKPGSDFLKIVPTVWDDTKFISGYPGDYVALARKNDETWYLGVLNNSIRKSIDTNLNFLAEGVYEMNIWEDTKKSDKEPVIVQLRKQNIKSGDVIRINLAGNGGYVATLKKIR